MTRAAIVQRLLDEDKITAEEAVVLLSPVGEESYTYNPTDLGYQPHRGTDSYWFSTSTIDDDRT